MVFGRAVLLTLALAVPLGGAMPPPAEAQGRPSCSAVVRQLHRTTGRNGAGKVSAEDVARKLRTDNEWVERCALSYGRRVQPGERKHYEGDEDLTAKREFREYEEVAREERHMEENYVQGDPDNYKDRDRRRGIDPDSSAEWEPYLTHQWQPYVTHQWAPFIRDDDDPGFD